MRTEDFHDWLSKASELTPSQRQQTIDHLSQQQEPDEVIGALVGPNPPCPHGHHASVVAGAMPMGCPGIAVAPAARRSMRSLKHR
ncbi:MAG: hypothetical protein WBJ41_06660 [Chromatiaceae bacterium]